MDTSRLFIRLNAKATQPTSACMMFDDVGAQLSVIRQDSSPSLAPSMGSLVRRKASKHCFVLPLIGTY